MALSIALTGLASSDPVPGNYVEINFAAGNSSGGENTYGICLLANKLSTGSATVDSVVYGPDSIVPLTSVSDANILFGRGSELARMYSKILAINSSTPVYAVAVTESGGAQALGSIVITGTITNPANIRVYVQDEFVDVAVGSSDSSTVYTAAIVAAINSKADWAVVASTITPGTVVLTARQKGPRGNWIRYSAKAFPQNCGFTVTPGAHTCLAGGTTADSNTAALATILPHRFYYIVSAADGYNADTQLTNLVAQVNTQALPINGLRQRVIAGNVDTVSGVQATAVALNAARATVIHQLQSDLLPGELAANAAAFIALEEAPAIPHCNFDNYGLDAHSSVSWKIKAPTSGATITRAQIVSLLNNGVTPIASTTRGAAYLVRLITTMSLTNSVADYRARDWHKVTVCDRFGDDLINRANAAFSGKLIADDPKPGQLGQGPNLVTPRIMKTMVSSLVKTYSDNSLVQNAGEIIANIICVRETSPSTRLSCKVPLQPIDCLHVTAFSVDQIS